MFKSAFNPHPFFMENIVADYYESFESIKNANYATRLAQAEPLIGRYVNQLGPLKAALTELVGISTDETLMVKDQLRTCGRILRMAKNQLHHNLEPDAFRFEGNKNLTLEFQLTKKLFETLSVQLDDLTQNLV